MSERWVPTGREFEEGTRSPVSSGQPHRRRNLLDRVLGRRRPAHTEVIVPPGVGEARSVVGPIDYDARLPDHVAEPKVPADMPPVVVAPKSPLAAPTFKAASATSKAAPRTSKAAPQGTTQPKKASGRATRRTAAREGLIPEVEPRSTADPNARIGSWPERMTEGEMRRQIGPIQNYGDST